MQSPRKQVVARNGAISVELAFLLPFLVFVAAIGVDFARIFSRTMVLETATRNAAMWAAQDPVKAADTAGIKAVAEMDLTDISPMPTVTSQIYMGADGFQYVKVTATHSFTTIMNFPGVPYTSQLNRSTDMRICPMYPKPGTY